MLLAMASQSKSQWKHILFFTPSNISLFLDVSSLREQSMAVIMSGLLQRRLEPDQLHARLPDYVPTTLRDAIVRSFKASMLQLVPFPCPTPDTTPILAISPGLCRRHTPSPFRTPSFRASSSASSPSPSSSAEHSHSLTPSGAGDFSSSHDEQDDGTVSVTHHEEAQHHPRFFCGGVIHTPSPVHSSGAEDSPNSSTTSISSNVSDENFLPPAKKMRCNDEPSCPVVNDSVYPKPQ